MNHTLSLHHCAKRIAPKTLEFVMELFKQLDCKESYWEEGARWAMIEQSGKSMIIQFIETKQNPQEINIKRNSHVAFLSENPEKDIERIGSWIKTQGFKFESGSWSDKEHYFDCPEVFIDFVIEVMHKSVADE